MHDEELTPEEAASVQAVDAAERFMMSIHVGDAEEAWASFSHEAKQTILRRGVNNGMPHELAQQIGANGASQAERASFMVNLMAGLQKDLESIDIPNMLLVAQAELHAPLQLRVRYLQELGGGVGPKLPPLPAGSIILTLEEETWRVERLIPRPD